MEYISIEENIKDNTKVISRNFKDMEYSPEPKSEEETQKDLFEKENLKKYGPISIKEYSSETMQERKRVLYAKTEIINFPNSNKKWKEFESIDGIKNGKYIEYFYDGTIKIQGNFIDGLAEGIFIENDENHIKFSESNYSNGKLDGEQKRFYPSGKIQKIFEFRNGYSTNYYQMFSEEGKNLTEIKNKIYDKITEKLSKLELLTHYKIRELTLLKNTLNEQKIESILNDENKKKIMETDLDIVL